MACSPAWNWGRALATRRQATLLPLHLPALEWNISVATIPSDQGSDFPPTSPTVDLRTKSARGSDGYWVSDFFISSQGFFIFSLYHYLHVFTWLCKNWDSVLPWQLTNYKANHFSMLESIWGQAPLLIVNYMLLYLGLLQLMDLLYCNLRQSQPEQPILYILKFYFNLLNWYQLKCFLKLFLGNYSSLVLSFYLYCFNYKIFIQVNLTSQ